MLIWLKRLCTIFQFVTIFIQQWVNRAFGQSWPECFLTPRAVECHWYATMLVKRFQCSYARSRAVGKILLSHPVVMARAWGLPFGTHSQMKNGERKDLFQVFRAHNLLLHETQSAKMLRPIWHFLRRRVWWNLNETNWSAIQIPIPHKSNLVYLTSRTFLRNHWIILHILSVNITRKKHSEIFAFQPNIQ